MNVWLAISLTLAVTAIYMFMIEVFSVAFKLTGLANQTFIYLFYLFVIK